MLVAPQAVALLKSHLPHLHRDRHLMGPTGVPPLPGHRAADQAIIHATETISEKAARLASTAAATADTTLPPRIIRATTRRLLLLVTHMLLHRRRTRKQIHLRRMRHLQRVAPVVMSAVACRPPQTAGIHTNKTPT